MKTLISRRVVTAVGAASLALLVAGCASSKPAASTATATPRASSATAAASPAAVTAAVLKTQHTKPGTVLTNAKGFTLYWFAADSPTHSACNGACAAAWPPVLGMPQAASGVTLTGKLGEIKRADGTMQATYNGHALYTFVGDTAPGQTNGNGSTGFGAKWSVIKVTSKVSAAAATTPVAAPSTPVAAPSTPMAVQSSSGGGSGYGSGSGSSGGGSGYGSGSGSSGGGW
jgi:predicted lipoprotein with Yx(FWY)xxD motif